MKPFTILGVLIPTLILYGVIEICRTLHKWHQQDKDTERLPGVPGRHWLLGTVIPDQNQRVLVINDLSKRYKVFKEWVGPKVIVHFVHPETVKKLLARSSKGDGFLHKILRPWAGNGLFLNEGAHWRRNRKLLTPAFHFKVLKSYIGDYNAATDILIEKWKRLQSNESEEICHPMHLLSLDILMRCAFSCYDDVQNRGDDHPYVKAVGSLQKLVIKRMVNVYYHFDFLYNLTSAGKRFKRNCAIARTMSANIIRERRMKLENPRNRKDFLDLLLEMRDEEGMGLTDLEMRDEIDTFLFAGHDTTSTAIPWILFCLATHFRHQKVCQREVDQLFVGRETEAIVWEDLSKIPYLTRCIKEAMRLYPPVHTAYRILTEPLEVEDVTLPAGIAVYCNILAVHHNASVWGEDCEEFKPDRFLPENMVEMNSYAFIPFLPGARNCIGQNFAMNEIKTVVSRILRCFWLEVDDTHDVQYKQRMTLQTVNGIKLRVVRRS